MPTPAVPENVDPHLKVGYLKERVYVAFTGLSIILALSFGDADHRSAQYVLAALLLGVLGVTSAAFAADVIAHLAVHRAFPDSHELMLIVRTTLGALSSVLVPAGLMVLAWIGVLTTDTALLLAGIVYVASIAVIVWLAVRNADITPKQKVAAMAILVGVGLLVLAIQVLAKG